jgi:hypothetical protein
MKMALSLQNIPYLNPRRQSQKVSPKRWYKSSYRCDNLNSSATLFNLGQVSRLH